LLQKLDQESMIVDQGRLAYDKEIKVNQSSNLDGIDELKRLEQAWVELGLEVGKEKQSCPIHGGHTLNVHRLDSGTIVYRCMNPSCEAHRGGTIIDFVRLLEHFDSVKDSIQFLADKHGIVVRCGASKEGSADVAQVVQAQGLSGPIRGREAVEPPGYYYDARGRRHEEIQVEVERGGVKLYESMRLDACTMQHVVSGVWGGREASIAVLRWQMPAGTSPSKIIRPFVQNARGGWTLGLEGVVSRPLYALDVIEAHPERCVLIVEGEKCMQAVRDLLDKQGVADQYIVTSCIGGASAVDATDLSVLAKHQGDVYVIPDCDEPGLLYARRLAAGLPDLAMRLIWVHPDREQAGGYDVADWIEQGHTELFDAQLIEALSYNAQLDDLMRRARCVTIETAEALLHELASSWRLEGLVLEAIFAAISQATDLPKSSIKARYRSYVMRLIAPHGFEHLVATKVVEEAFGGHLLCVQGLWWTWTGRHWEKLFGYEDVCEHIEPVAKRHWHEQMDMVKLLKGVRDILPMMCNRSTNELTLNALPQAVLNCTNTELVLRPDGSFAQRTHQPKHHAILALDVAYDPEATCPSYDAALELWFNGDQELIDYWHEVAGYLIQPDRWLKHFFLLQGEGDNGKTTLMHIITKLCAGAVAHIEVQNLGERFGLAPLVGKLIALDDDVKAGTKLPDGILKKLSEAKATSIEYKNKTPVDLMLVAAPVMLCNRWPSISDVTPATLDRAVCIPFLHSIPQSKRNPKLLETIFTHELSGVLNRCLQGLSRLRARGYFHHPYEVVSCKQRFLSSANHTIAWANDRIERIPSARGAISTPGRELYDDYIAWCTEQGFHGKTVSMSALARILEGLSMHVQAGSARDGRFRVWGARLIDDSEVNSKVELVASLLTRSENLRDIVFAQDLIAKIQDKKIPELAGFSFAQLRALVEQAGFIVKNASPRYGRFKILAAKL